MRANKTSASLLCGAGGQPSKLLMHWRDDQSPPDSALRERMLMMARRRQRITSGGNHFGSTALAFINSGVWCRRARFVRRIEFRVREISQVVRVFVLRHGSGDPPQTSEEFRLS